MGTARSREGAARGEEDEEKVVRDRGRDAVETRGIFSGAGPAGSLPLRSIFGCPTISRRARDDNEIDERRRGKKAAIALRRQRPENA